MLFNLLNYIFTAYLTAGLVQYEVQFIKVDNESLSSIQRANVVASHKSQNQILRKRARNYKNKCRRRKQFQDATLDPLKPLQQDIANTLQSIVAPSTCKKTKVDHSGSKLNAKKNIAVCIDNFRSKIQLGPCHICVKLQSSRNDYFSRKLSLCPKVRCRNVKAQFVMFQSPL